ncbi:MAG: hypothetical protein O3C40_37800 [Planctomycetota bacterium]|nr:hypothetical protein [Planctomycetota bacterium]
MLLLGATGIGGQTPRDGGGLVEGKRSIGIWADTKLAQLQAITATIVASRTTRI